MGKIRLSEFEMHADGDAIASGRIPSRCFACGNKQVVMVKKNTVNHTGWCVDTECFRYSDLTVNTGWIRG